jgi:hypothetical protein
MLTLAKAFMVMMLRKTRNRNLVKNEEERTGPSSPEPSLLLAHEEAGQAETQNPRN